MEGAVRCNLRGGGRDFCESREEYRFVRAIFCRSIGRREEGDSESEKFTTVNGEAQLSASDSSRTIDKEESRAYVTISRRILFSPR